MRLVKKINNNFAFALDGNGEKIIVEGRGIGFVKKPCDLNDFSSISRTYYNVSDEYVELINQIPQNILDISNKTCEYLYSKAKAILSPNLPFTLADHIAFAVKRMENGMMLSMPMYYDLMQMYPIEFSAAEYCVKLIKKNLKIQLPKDEVAGIAMNLLNSEMDVHKTKIAESDEELVAHILNIIEKDMQVSISENSVDYARFRAHMNYLFKRLREKKPANTSNQKMYEEMRNQYKQTSDCVEDITLYLNDRQYSLSNEEKLYLMLHINRICERSQN